MDQKVIQEVLRVLKDIQLELRGNAERRLLRVNTTMNYCR